MRRLKNPRPERVDDDKQIDLLNFVAPPEKDKKRRAMSQQQFQKLLVETNDLKMTKRWDEFTPRHFVGMYCLLHHYVYSVFPHEVRDNYMLSVGAAQRMLKNEFKGDTEQMIVFMRWVWKRESEREKSRDANSTFRIGWRLQFGRQLLSDFRVAKTRGTRRRR